MPNLRDVITTARISIRESMQGQRKYRTFERIRNSWFTISISFVMFLSLTAIGISREQVIGALIDYAPGTAERWWHIAWGRILVVDIGFLFVTIGLAYWSAKLMDEISDGAGPKLKSHRNQIDFQRFSGLLQWVVIAVFVLPWLGLCWALLSAAEELSGGSIVAQFIHPFGIFAVINTVVFLLLIGVWIHPMAARLRRLVYGDGAVSSWIARFAAVVFAIFAVTFMISPGHGTGSINSVAFGRLMGPITIIAIALGVFASLGSWIIIIGRRHGVQYYYYVLGVIFVFSALNLSDNHPIYGNYARTPATPKSLINVYEDWRGSRGITEGPVILVSAEGGGIRAAYFTATILGRLADRCPQAARRIFAISSVSGGAVGTAAYVGAVQTQPKKIIGGDCELIGGEAVDGGLEESLQEIFAEDHLTPMLGRMFFPDALARLNPFGRYWDKFSWTDRQRGLEESVSRSFAQKFNSDAIDRPLSWFPANQNNGLTPVLFFNVTRTGDGGSFSGSQFAFLNTNEPNGDDEVPSGSDTAANPPARTGAPNKDVFDVQTFALVNKKFDPTLVSIAGASARFPFVSPAGYVEGIDKKRQRFVDGGYFDNSGVETIMEVYRELEKYHQGKTPKTDIIIIHIGNSLAGNCYGSTNTECKDKIPTEYFSGLLSPLRAVLNTRPSRTEETLEEFQRAEDNGATVAELRLKECVAKIPLGWYLSHLAQQEIMAHLDLVDDKSKAEGLYEILQRKYNGESCAQTMSELNKRSLQPVMGMFQQ